MWLLLDRQTLHSHCISQDNQQESTDEMELPNMLMAGPRLIGSHAWHVKRKFIVENATGTL